MLFRSASLPVISTLEGAISDIVDNTITGVIVQQKRVTELAEELKSLLQTPQKLQMMGENGRLKFEREFKLEVFEKRLISIFQVTKY